MRANGTEIRALRGNFWVKGLANLVGEEGGSCYGRAMACSDDLRVLQLGPARIQSLITIALSGNASLTWWSITSDLVPAESMIGGPRRPP